MTTPTAAFETYLRSTPGPIYLGQLRIGPGWWLGHRDDVLPLSSSGLLVHLRNRADLREWIKTDATGAFRPVRGLRTLRRGWKMGPLSVRVLVDYLHLIYPGSIADWAYREQGVLPVTEFTETAARQTGMYRITQLLKPDQLAELTRDVCDPSCLRTRLWPPTTQPAEKTGEIPVFCPEACNYLVGKAREKIKGKPTATE